MFKWILGIFLIYFCIGIYISYSSASPQISKQIDVKTMSFTNPSYISETFSICEGNCTNRSSSSSSSSWGGGSSGGK